MKVKYKGPLAQAMVWKVGVFKRGEIRDVPPSVGIKLVQSGSFIEIPTEIKPERDIQPQEEELPPQDEEISEEIPEEIPEEEPQIVEPEEEVLDEDLPEEKPYVWGGKKDLPLREEDTEITEEES